MTILRGRLVDIPNENKRSSFSCLGAGRGTGSYSQPATGAGTGYPVGPNWYLFRDDNRQEPCDDSWGCGSSYSRTIDGNEFGYGGNDIVV